MTQILALVPPWVRVYRIQRDIPMPLVSSSGVVQGHLRDLVLERMKDMGLKCRDVRTREVGMQEIHNKVKKKKGMIMEQISPNEIELIRRDYSANEGWETFLAYEDPHQDILIGLLRLRKCPKDCFREELRDGCSIIRELHVYGTALKVQGKDMEKYQHRGFGALLIEEAEKIAYNEHGSKKMAIISGIGTRNYYRKFGYELEGPYMVKDLIFQNVLFYKYIIFKIRFNLKRAFN